MPSQEQMRFPGWVLDEAILPSARVRQGDLIKFEGVANPLRQLAIIVTADCDLEQTKHARTLTLVPVVSAKTVFDYYLIPDDCEKKKHLIQQFFLKLFGIPSDQDDDAKRVMLRDRLIAAERDLTPALAKAAKMISDDEYNITFTDYKTAFTEMKLAPRKIESFKDQLRQRGDLLILPEAEQLGIKGHIAWVRQLWQMSASDVAIRTSEVSTRAGERIARLDSPFRYRLTQLIAHVFSDIGLPDLVDSVDQILDEAYG